jgi:hypothetical protein
MPSLDIAMPIALFMVVIVALLLNKRTEGKLMTTVEDKEFKTRDIVVLVIFMAIAVSGLALAAMYTPAMLFEDAILVFFLFSYSMLLFTFSYVFSGIPKIRVQLVSTGFGIASIIAAIASTLEPLQDAFTIVRVGAFIALAVFCFGVAVYEQKDTLQKARWYVAAQPPAIFVLLFVSFNFLRNSGTSAVWTPYLMDVFAITFAVLIILYLSPIFSWKTVGLFAILLTTMDIILVIGSTAMVTAATAITKIGFPVMVILPNFPIATQINPVTHASGIVFRGLGLGDYFFAGILAVQTYKKFGMKTAIIAVIAMAISFGIWEMFLLDIVKGLIPILGRDIKGWPATTCMLTGWAPVVAAALLLKRRKNPIEQPSFKKSSPPTTSPAENPPTIS